MRRPRRRRRPALVVLRALGLGDLLTAVPALRGIARAFPGHRRVLAAPAALAPLLELVRERDRPVVDGVVDVAPLATLPGRLAGAEVAVNLHGRGPESHRVLLALEPGRMLAFAHPAVPESWDGPRWIAGEHEVARWCRMLAECGVECDPADVRLEAPSLRGSGLPRAVKGATVIHPGAASEARRWPAERWAEVARAEHEDGRAVFVTGARCELALAGAVAAAAGLAPDRVLAGRTDVRELAAIVGSAACVLCGDTGVGHLASALGTPSVLLFGPVSPQEWGPTGACERRHVAIWHGHRGDPHAAVPDPGLLEIGVGEVLEAVDGLERERPRLRAA